MLPVFVKEKTGNIYLREGLRYVKGRYLVPASLQNPITTPAAAGATTPSYSPPVILEGQDDAFSQIFALSGLHTSSDNTTVKNRLCTKLYDAAYRRDLMNGYILADHVFGTNLHPFKLCESLSLEPKQTLQATFQNNSVLGDSHFKQAYETRIFQQPSWNMPGIKDRLDEIRKRRAIFYPYWLTSDAPISIAASGTADIFFTVNQNIRYVIWAVMARGVSSGQAGNTTEQFTYTMFDPATTRELSNQSLIRSVSTGTNEFPHFLPTGWMISPNSKIRVTFTNLITDASLVIYFTFFGTAINSDAWTER